MTRPLKDCLDLAADELEAGHGHAALQEAAVSLEYHLDTLARAKQPTIIDPVLLPELARLEQRLSSLLVRGWEYARAFDAGASPTPLALTSYAGEMRAASRQEIALVFASLVATGGET